MALVDQLYIVVVNKEEKTAVLVDVAIPSDQHQGEGTPEARNTRAERGAGKDVGRKGCNSPAGLLAPTHPQHLRPLTRRAQSQEQLRYLALFFKAVLPGQMCLI